MPPFSPTHSATALEKTFALIVTVIFLGILIYAIIITLRDRKRQKQNWILKHEIADIEKRMRQNKLVQTDYEKLDELLKPYRNHPLIRGLPFEQLSSDLKIRFLKWFYGKN